MNRFRYDASGRWFKGNLHTHSTFSDGGKTPEELAVMYAANGHDFLCLTDHWVVSNSDERVKPAPLLWLDGVELDSPRRRR